MLELPAERPCTTTELAAGLRLSMASASQQAKVLREAGLIVSTQRGRKIVHQSSALGVQLLGKAANIA